MKPTRRVFIKTEKKTHERRAKAYDSGEKVLNSYIDKGVIKVDASSGDNTKFPDKLASVVIPEKSVALNDDLASNMNRLSQAVIVESGQADVFKHREVARKSKGKEEEVDMEEDEEEQEEVVATAPSIYTPVDMDTEFNGPDIVDLQDYKLRDDRDQLFFKHLEVDDCVPDTLVSDIPHWKDILKYTQTIEAGRKFYENMSQMVVFTEGATFPQLEVLNRRYIQEFLRTPTAGNAWERPCGIEKCESLRLSAYLLERHPQMRKQGLLKGFRCRELLLPNRYVKIREELKKKKNGKPEKHLTPYLQPCYLCHLRIVNDAYWTLLNRRKQREKDSTEQRVVDATVILHRFVVVADTTGEYRMKDMLVGDNEPMGIIGPFPCYNVNNYTPYMDQHGRCAWREADKLVFRLPEQQLAPIDPQDTSSVSILSGPTTSQVRRTSYPQ